MRHCRFIYSEKLFFKRVGKNTHVVDKREWGAVDKLFGCPAERLVKSVNQGQGYFFLFN